MKLIFLNIIIKILKKLFDLQSMIIKVDYREKKLLTMLNAKLEELELKHITIIIESLPLGDIIICDDKCIEKIIEINLSEEEKNNFDISIKAVQDLFLAAIKIDSSLK